MYKKIEIKTEADLPEDEGWYEVMYKRPRKRFKKEYYNSLNKKLWLEDIDWYLSPVKELTDEEIEKRAIGYKKSIGNVRYSNEAMFDFISGAKFYRDRDKH